jgi:hypothetical protein
MLDDIESFVAGFGDRNSMDINNAAFIAKELLNLNLPLEFRGAGRLGVKSLELYGILEDIRPNQKNQETFHIGMALSGFDSRELMLMASYLWNEGMSSLDEDQREEALILLQEKFGVKTEEEQAKKLSAATASG